MSDAAPHKPKSKRWLTWVLAVPLVYALSTGPVLGVGFWLRDRTNWNGFYWVMIPYMPLLFVENDNPFAKYMDFWVEDVFDTSFPG